MLCTDSRSAAETDVPSVAYIQFRDPAKELAFAKAFHGHVFRDSKGMCDMSTHSTGVESTALVDYALVSTLPTSRKPQPDPLIGTVEQSTYGDCANLCSAGISGLPCDASVLGERRF